VVLMVRVDDVVPGDVTVHVAGLVAPAGPETLQLNATLLLNPLAALTPILDVPDPPWSMVKAVGSALRVKLGDAIVAVTVAVELSVPDVPVTVKV
jgi:hypothetical protein